MGDFFTFPIADLPVQVARFVGETADAMGCDPAFIALPALSVLGAAIGTTRGIELKRGWCESPVIWTCIIARSGTMKSPAMEAAIAPLAETEHRAQLSNQTARTEYETALLHHEKELAIWKRKGEGDPPTKPESPARERYIIADCTLEAIAPLLLENPRGLLLARDELAAWIRGFNQYKSGKGGDAAAWLELNRAGRLTVDRKSGGTIYIPRAAVSICGTIQPGVFASAMRGEHFESGLAARLLVAQPPTMAKRFSIKSASATAQRDYAAALNILLSLAHEQGEHGPRPFRLRLEERARDEWKCWYDRHAKRQHEAGEDSEAAALAKIEAYAARFALIFALVADPNAVEVSVDAVRRGCTLADWFAGEAERVYSRLADDEETRELRQFVGWIKRKGGSVTARDLSRGPRKYRGDVAKAESDLAALADAGLGTFEYGGNQSGGQPSRVFVLYSDDIGDGDITRASAIGNESIVAVAASPSAKNDGEWGSV